jgi:hypothetical protein
MAMRRGAVILLSVVGVLFVLGGAFLWALPEIVRRITLDQIPKRTGRAAAIDDVDLNVFTGRVALTNVRLTERRSPESFVALERVEVRLGLPALLRSEIRLADVTVVAPAVRVVRTGPAEFNFSDLLARPPTGPAPETSASAWTVTVDRLAVFHGTVTVDDRGVTPATQWHVKDLRVDAGALTTRPGAAPGRVAVHATIDGAVLDVNAERLGVEPPRLGATLSLTGFETRRLNAYVFGPLGTPYAPKSGRLSATLDAQIDSDARELTRATITGTVSLEAESLTQIGVRDPFLDLARLSVHVKEADALNRSLTVASVAVDGLHARVRRDANGVIDLLRMITAKPAMTVKTTPASPTAAPERTLVPVLKALSRGFETIRVERITLAPGTVTFVDESVEPVTTLALTRLEARVDNVTWPVTGPATLVLSTALPGGGTLRVNGPVTPQPLDADLTFALRDAPVTPYQAYIPVPARLSGRMSGDSRNRIALKNGTLVLASKGNSWAQDVEIRAPGERRPVIRVARMDLTGIDVDWPRRAAVARAGFRRLAVEVERQADGTINVRRLFEPARANATPAATAAPPARASTAPAQKGLLETLAIDIQTVSLQQGFIRFLDRTTAPAFSQDMSQLELTVTGLGNRPGARAKLALQSVVGGDATLDVRGEVGPIGGPPFADIVGELRSFNLASIDPYAEAAIGWFIKKGALEYKVRFKLDGDQLAATNEIVVGQLQVAPSSGGDEVKQRLGLPLGLIVALIKDSKGDIRANVPVTGSLGDPKFDLRDTIWTAVKNVVVNLVKAPFRAISRLFSRNDTLEEPKVDPVTFAAGSSVLAPDMETHVLRVADFLRRTPFVNVTLAPAASAADLAALRAEAVTTRLATFQQERGLKDVDAALAVYFEERLPGVTRPETPDEQLALLRDREPPPDAALVELGRRRVDATRERLVNAEGIPTDRLAVSTATPVAPAGDGAGRVEFSITTAGQ